MCVMKKAQIPEGSEFQRWQQMLKLQEAKVMWSRVTNNRLVLEENRECVENMQEC